MTVYRFSCHLHPLLAAGLVFFALAGTADGQGSSPLLSKEWAPPAMAGGSSGYGPMFRQHRAFAPAGGVGHQRDGRPVIGGLAFRAYRDDPDSPLPKAYSDGYSLRFPLLESISSVPLFGRLYDVVSIGKKDEGGADFRPVNVVRRVPEERTPEDVLQTVNSYVFPLHDGPAGCGTLHSHFIYVQGTDDAKPGRAALRVHVGLLSDIKLGKARRETEIRWTWLAEGDVLDVDGHKHRLLRIVPPQLSKHGLLRRVGWFELGPKPVGDEDPPPLPTEEPAF